MISLIVKDAVFTGDIGQYTEKALRYASRGHAFEAAGQKGDSFAHISDDAKADLRVLPHQGFEIRPGETAGQGVFYEAIEFLDEIELEYHRNPVELEGDVLGPSTRMWICGSRAKKRATPQIFPPNFKKTGEFP
jgi:hypothetical protein